MKRFVVAVLTCTAVIAAAPAVAARPGPTDPVASPRTVYPYVAEGRTDATTITFSSTRHPVLNVYDLEGTLLFSRAIPDEPYAWNPRTEGDVLGTDPTDAAGLVFRVCVNRRGRSTRGAAYCTKVRVVHVVEDAEVSRTRLGREFDRKTVDGDCRVRREDRATVIRCGAGASAVLGYDLRRPALTPEQTLLAPATFDWKGRYFEWGDGISLDRTVRGADVTASQNFWGKLTWVRKTWTVRTEF
jgi:hypothetical protein